MSVAGFELDVLVAFAVRREQKEKRDRIEERKGERKKKSKRVCLDE